MKTNLLQIRTPEGVVFSQSLAGPVTRFLAWLVDAACILTILTFLNIIMALLSMISLELSRTFNVLGFFVIGIGYGIFCEWRWRGQTLGKRLLRLRVVDAEGLRLQFNQIMTRNLLRAVDSLPVCYFLGGTVSWFNRRGQRLGDIAANTVVIRLPQLAEPDLDQLLAGKFNSLRTHPHLAARLRQRISAEEAAIALEALVRRDEFEPLARVELFSELARHFRAKVEFPAEALEGITDEQFLRNIVDVVYHTRADKTRPPEPVTPVSV